MVLNRSPKFESSHPSAAELRQVVLKRIFFIISNYFYESNLGLWCGLILYPRILHLNNFGKKSLVNATYYISNI